MLHRVNKIIVRHSVRSAKPSEEVLRTGNIFQNRGSTREDKIIRQYGELVDSRIQLGFCGYLLSFLFSELGTNARVIKHRIAEEMGRVYSTALTHVVRYPNRCSLDELPLWIGCIDVPVFKRERQRVAETSVNDGLHAHVVALIPRDSRLRVPFDVHLKEREAYYVRRPIIEISSERITKDPVYVADYVLKGLRRPRVTFDDVFVRPRTWGELSR